MPGTYLAFDIGSKNIHAVLGQSEGNSVKILKSTTVPLAKGLIVDGLINNMEVLELAMKEAVSRLDSNTKDAYITFNSNSVVIREFEVPTGDTREIEAMIKNEATQYFGMTDTDLIEYRKIGETQSNDSKKVKIRAAVMNREIAHGYYDLLQRLRLRPIALDIHPNVISKIVDGRIVINGNSTDNFMILDIGYSSTMIYLISQNSLNFFRNVTFGGKAVDRLLINAFSLQDEKVEETKLALLSCCNERVNKNSDTEGNVDHKSHLIKKNGHSFVVKKKGLTSETPEKESVSDTDALTEDTRLQENYTGEHPNEISAIDALTAVKPLYGQLLEELRKVLQYYNNRSSFKGLDHIYLMGGGACLSGLQEYLSQGLGFEVAVVRSLSMIQLKENDQALSSILNAAGVLIRQ